MRTVILGAGALGSIYAAYLARAGEEVTLLARGARAEQVRAHGITVTGLEEFTVPVPVETDPARIEAADCLVVTVKTYDTLAAIEPLRHLRLDAALSVQNGVRKDADLASVFGAEHTVGAVAFNSGEVLADGSVRFTLNRALVVGELPEGISERTEAIAATFERAGIHARAIPDVARVTWTKFAGWAASVGLATLERLETWRLMSDPDSARVAVALVREAVAVAEAEGIEVDDQGPLPCRTLKELPLDEAVARVQQIGAHFRDNAPQHRLSMLQDLERGKRLEADAVMHLVDLAAAHGIPVPASEACYRMIAAIDRALAGSG